MDVHFNQFIAATGTGKSNTVLSFSADPDKNETNCPLTNKVPPGRAFGQERVPHQPPLLCEQDHLPRFPGIRAHEGNNSSETDSQGKLKKSSAEERAEVEQISGDPSQESNNVFTNQRSGGGLIWLQPNISFVRSGLQWPLY